MTRVLDQQTTCFSFAGGQRDVTGRHVTAVRTANFPLNVDDEHERFYYLLTADRPA